MPVLRSAVIFTEGLSGIGKRCTERFNFLFLCLDFLIQHLVSGRKRFYGFIVFIKLRGHDLHFRAEDLKGLVDFGQCLLKFLLALKTNLQTEIIRHQTTSLDSVRDNVIDIHFTFWFCHAVILLMALPKVQ